MPIRNKILNASTILKRFPLDKIQRTTYRTLRIGQKSMYYTINDYNKISVLPMTSMVALKHKFNSRLDSIVISNDFITMSTEQLTYYNKEVVKKEFKFYNSEEEYFLDSVNEDLSLLEYNDILKIKELYTYMLNDANEWLNSLEPSKIQKMLK